MLILDFLINHEHNIKENNNIKFKINLMNP